MKKKESLNCLCLLGAIIGAGFASGREIMHFFSRYGAWSYALAALSGLMMTALIYLLMRRAQSGQSMTSLLPTRGWQKGLFVTVLAALYAVTGGGMLAAAGEVLALTLPIRYAYWYGLLLTLCLCILLYTHTLRPLEWLSRLMLPLLVLCFLLVCRAPAMEEVQTEKTMPHINALFGALGYAGLNVMLVWGVIQDAGRQCSARTVCRSCAWLGAALFFLLFLGNTALLRHPETAASSLPTVFILRTFGLYGYYLSAALLYLAIVTTLLACMRALKQLLFPRACLTAPLVLLCSLAGFDRLVSRAYPMIGLICLILLLFILKRRKVMA